MIRSYELLEVPGPIPTALSEPFWAAARRNELALQRCEACAQWFSLSTRALPALLERTGFLASR